MPESIVVQQVITYGEITDFRKPAALLPKQNIIDALAKWQNKEKSLDSHLMPAENITKERIAAFFADQLRKIKDEID